jgi:hypothetical protein
MLAPEKFMGNWRQQQPSNQGDSDWNVTRLKISYTEDRFLFQFGTLVLVCCLGYILNDIPCRNRIGVLLFQVSVHTILGKR